MLEHVGRRGRADRRIHEFGTFQRAQALGQSLLAEVDQRCQDGVGKLDADGGRALEHVPSISGEPMDTRGERVLHGGGKGVGHNIVGCAIRPGRAGEPAGLRQRPHGLLEEEGIPLGPRQKLRLERRILRGHAEQIVEQLVGGRGGQ